MIHDRYHASKRNPWNEVECSSHYARAMASYGVFLAACGFACDGPKGRLGFAPRLTPNDFRAPFTAAEGWGTFRQRADAGGLQAEVRVKWGRVRLRELSLAPGGIPGSATARVTAAGKPVRATCGLSDGQCKVALERDVVLKAGETLQVVLHG
jgi:hypothetical protein